MTLISTALARGDYALRGPTDLLSDKNNIWALAEPFQFKNTERNK